MYFVVCPLFFIPCDWSCSTPWMWVPSPGCWRCLATVFCSMCCGLCAAAWVTVLVYCLCGWCAFVSLLLFICAALLEGNVSLLFRISDCSVRWVCHISGFHFSFLCNVKFLLGVEHSSLSLILNYVHYFIHWAKGVPFVNNMLGECGYVVYVFKKN